MTYRSMATGMRVAISLTNMPGALASLWYVSVALIPKAYSLTDDSAWLHALSTPGRQ